MSRRSVMDIIRNLLKKAEDENRTEEVKERIREHLIRTKDNPNAQDNEEWERFFYENEGQPRAIRSMNLQAKLDGEDGWASDATIIEEAVRRRKEGMPDLPESFSSSAQSDLSIEEPVEEILARAEEVNNCEGSDAGRVTYNFAIDHMDDRDVESLAGAFAHRAFVHETSFTAKSDDYAYALVKKMEEDELVAAAYAFPHRCVID